MRDGSEPRSFDWAALVPLLVHPAKVEIIEAMAHIDRPLSATDLKNVFDGELDLSHVAYHVLSLAKVKAIVKVRQRQSRGAVQKFYSLP